MHCDICHKEIAPETDKIVQIRDGYINNDGDFVPKMDSGYFHSGCFDGVDFPDRRIYEKEEINDKKRTST